MRRFIGLIIAVGFILIPTVALSQMPWDAAFEADPAVNDPVSEGDDRIREAKTEISSRAEVEHWWGDTGAADDNGLHRLGSARCFMGTALPTILADASEDYANDTGVGDPDLDDISHNSAAGDRNDIGDGRCFVDINGPDNAAGTDDDYTMYIYEGAAGDAGCPAPAGADDCWHAVVADSPYESSDDEILAGSYNLMYNGSFEATDGTGEPIVAPGGLFAVAGPEGWQDSLATSPFYHYTNPSGDIRYGDGYHLVITNNGAADEGVEQTLTNLRANTIYKVIARVIDDGVAECDLDVVGETTALAGTLATTTDLWETLTGTFGTGAVLETVDVSITTDGIDGQACGIDHVAVYEIGDVGTDRDEVSQPGIIGLYDSDATVAAVSGAFGTVPNLELIFTMPDPGWVVQVGYSISVESVVVNPGETYLKCRLDDAITGNIDSTTRAAYFTGSATDYISGTLSAIYINPNLTPGTTYTFTVECADDGVAVGEHLEYNDSTVGASGGGLAPDNSSVLWLMAYPAR